MNGYFLVFLHILTENVHSKESYIILPRTYKFCKDSSNIRDLTITKQISLNFDGSQSIQELNDTKSLRYVCQVIVKPLGRHISIHYNEGIVNFWKLRLKINYHIDCRSSLVLEFLNEEKTFVPENTVQSKSTKDKPVTQVYSCSNDYPIILNANSRKISIYWQTKELTSLDSQSIDIELSTYMNFEGNFTLQQKENNCILQYGFWCGSDVPVCINAQMRCDESDSCFDGGTDEQGCPPPRNMSHHRLNSRQQKGSWTSYIPWIVIGALPLILLFALVLICSQRKHGLDSFPSDAEDDTFHNQDGLDEICNKHVEKRENNCSDLVGGAEGFSICYGGKIHRLSGDPRDSCSLDSCDSTNQWTNTTEYLSQDSHQSGDVGNTHQEIHSNMVLLDENASDTPFIGMATNTKPNMCRKIMECPGETSPTLTNGSSLNETSPTRVKSQISVLTFCGSERSTGLVRSPSGEEEQILMNNFSSHNQDSENSDTGDGYKTPIRKQGHSC